MKLIEGNEQVNGVGRKLIDAYRSEATSGDGRDYALSRVAALLDQIAEIPEAHQLLGKHYNRTLEILDRRRRLKAVE